MESALAKYGGAVKENLDQAAERSAKDTLANFIDQFVRMSARQPQIHRILTADGTQAMPRLEWLVDHFLRWNCKSVCDLLRRGKVQIGRESCRESAGKAV